MTSVTEFGKPLTEIGSFKLTTTKLYVSDPCYSRGRNDLALIVSKCAKGTWDAAVEYNNEGRVSILVVKNFDADDSEGSTDVFDSHLAVDSGRMGIYDNKFFPKDGENGEYGDEDTFYGKACNITLDKTAGIIDNFGVVSISGWGDGCYTGVVYRNAEGVAYSVLVDFHCSDEGT